MKKHFCRSPTAVASALALATAVSIGGLSYGMFIERPVAVSVSTLSAANAYAATIDLKAAVQMRLDEVRWSDVDFDASVGRFSDALIHLEEASLVKLSDEYLVKTIEAVKLVAEAGADEVPAALETLNKLERFTLDAWRKADEAVVAEELKARAHTESMFFFSLGAVLALGGLATYFGFVASRAHNRSRDFARSNAALHVAATDLQIRSARILESKNEFLAMVSHELRSPLQTLLSSIQLLENPNSDLNKILPRLKRSSLALDTQFGDLLSLAKADRVNFETGPVAVSALINRVCLSHRATAKANGVVFSVDVSKSTWIVETCGVRLFQVLDNLVSNAVRYTPKGSIYVSVSPVDHTSTSLTITVKDTGYGIKAEDLPRIFLPFTRFHAQYDAPETAWRSRKGGMGLAIVKALVDGIGGTVKVSSTVGEGTTFVVTVPCRPLSPVTLKSRRETCVLVVDDEPDILAAISDILSLEHVDVRTAKSVSQGLRVWEASQPLLVLLDLNLPDGNGREIAQKIRYACASDRRLPRPVIVAISAAISESAVADGVFDGFLAKPIDASHLAHLVNSLCYDAALQ